jgi:peptide/nickel transport system permease protein
VAVAPGEQIGELPALEGEIDPGARHAEAVGAETPQHLVLPSITLGVLFLATFARITRSSFLEETYKDYVRTAKAKGISRHQIIVRHLLRNTAIPLITVVSLSVANLLGGAVVTETIFAWPGIGRLAMESIAARDYPLVQAVVLISSVMYVLSSLLADLLYTMVDPRIRVS